MRGEGLETVRKRWWGRMGSGGIAFSGGSPCFTARQTTQWQKQDKTSLPQGTRLSTPRDRLHKHRQAFSWHPSWSTRGQTTNMTDKPSLGTPLRVPGDRLQTWQTSKVYHETDYTTHKAFPCHSSQSIQVDRLHQDGQIFHWSPSWSTRRQTTNMQTSLLLAPLLAKTRRQAT